VADLVAANVGARAWCAAVNAQVHSEIMQVPAQRLMEEREVLRPLPLLRAALRAAEQRRVDRRGTVRFGSARYLVPKTLVANVSRCSRVPARSSCCTLAPR